MIDIQNLTAGYPGKPVLQDISLTIPAGQVTVIAGPNGCGKSTLLKTLCGILPPGSGIVTVAGKALATYGRQELARTVAYLAQSRQVPDITARRLVLHGRFPYLSYPRRYRPEDLRITQAAMARMGIEDLGDTPLATLSGGQRQKVYLAMALAQDTPVILLDEPTTYLDVAHQLQMMAQAKQLCREGKTVVMVLHDLSQALQSADHLVVLDRGRVIRHGTPEEIYRSQCLEEVFQVHLGRIETNAGWRYYYE